MDTSNRWWIILLPEKSHQMILFNFNIFPWLSYFFSDEHHHFSMGIFERLMNVWKIAGDMHWPDSSSSTSIINIH